MDVSFASTATASNIAAPNNLLGRGLRQGRTPPFGLCTKHEMQGDEIFPQYPHISQVERASKCYS